MIALGIRIVLAVIVALINPEGFWEFDSHGYATLAENMLKNGVFSRSEEAPLLPDFFRTPGYPAFLLPMAAGAPPLLPVLLQHALAALAAFSLYYTCRNFGFSKTVALASTTFLAFDISGMIISNMLLSDSLFATLITFSLYFFSRYYRLRKPAPLIVCGIILGVATLVRPSGTLLITAFAVGAIAIEGKKAVLVTALFLSASFICIFPWMLRNYFHFKKPVISTVGDFNISYWHGPIVVADVQAISIEEARHKLWKEGYNSFRGSVQKDPIGYSRHLRNTSLKHIAAAPFTYLKHHAINVFYLLTKPARGDIQKQLGMSKDAVSLYMLVFIQMLFIILLLACAIPGVIEVIKNHPPVLGAILLLLALLLINVIIPGATYCRYRLPVMPLLSILAAAGVERLLQRARLRDN